MTSYEGETRRFTREDEQPQQADSGDICALIEDLLPLYVEGEVNPGSRDLIVHHLGRCAHCAGFLAGAQSVRNQLRTQTQQRSSAVQADQPAQQTVAGAQLMLQGITFVIGGALGSFGAALIGESLRYGYGGSLLAGTALGSLGLSMLLLLARARGANFARITLLLGSCVLSTLGVVMMSATPLGLLVYLLGAFGTWSALFQGAPGSAHLGGRTTAVQLAKIFAGVVAGLLLLGGIGLLVGALQSSISMSGMLILAMIGVLFFAQGRANSYK